MQFLVPLALKQCVLPVMGFKPHAEALHQSRRSGIAGIAAGEDAMEVELVKPHGQRGLHRFLGVALPAVNGVENEAQLRLLRGGIRPAQTKLADDLGVRLALDGQKNAVARPG